MTGTSACLIGYGRIIFYMCRSWHLEVPDSANLFAFLFLLALVNVSSTREHPFWHSTVRLEIRVSKVVKCTAERVMGPGRGMTCSARKHVFLGLFVALIDEEAFIFCTHDPAAFHCSSAFIGPRLSWWPGQSARHRRCWSSAE